MTRNKSSASTDPEFLDAISLLTEELKILRIVIDELRTEVQWNNQNSSASSQFLTSRRIHSCSLDPTSRNFEVNTVDQVTIESLRAELTPNRAKRGSQGELFN